MDAVATLINIGLFGVKIIRHNVLFSISLGVKVINQIATDVITPMQLVKSYGLLFT